MMPTSAQFLIDREDRLIVEADESGLIYIHHNGSLIGFSAEQAELVCQAIRQSIAIVTAGKEVK